MASLSMGEAVRLGEGRMPRIGYPGYERNAAQHLVAQMFTDAVFNQDIRTIATIINRIDGGLPKDTEVDDYQTLFGDAMTQVLESDKASQLKVTPDDTVMLALCKSLYDLASQDIYWDPVENRRCKPSTDRKKDRDAALRMVLERAGGRKTTTQVQDRETSYELAGWISEAKETCPDQEKQVDMPSS